MREDIRRGTVIEVKLDPAIGSEASKKRPCVVIQNDVGNRLSPLTIVAAIIGAEHVPQVSAVDVWVPRGEGGLLKDSVVKCNHLRSIDQLRIGRSFGQLPPATMRRVEVALRVSLDL
jgi:mRNA interferase MazF